MHDLSRWAHRHDYGNGNAAAERGTRLVLWIPLATMLLEIGAGWWFNSMAVLADGWHMSSHALAIGLSALAYQAARHYADDPSLGVAVLGLVVNLVCALILGQAHDHGHDHGHHQHDDLNLKAAYIHVVTDAM